MKRGIRWKILLFTFVKTVKKIFVQICKKLLKNRIKTYKLYMKTKEKENSKWEFLAS